MYWPGAPEKGENPQGGTSQFIEGLSYRSKGEQEGSSFTCRKGTGRISGPSSLYKRIIS